MIPKIIHYCWFGGNPLPAKAKKCIASWKKYCPDWEIAEWNESNCDLGAAPLYVRQAYEHKKWAFVSDYFRLFAVESRGGVYLDTDVEMVRSFEPLLEHKAFFGLEYPDRVATGLGFGAEKGAPVLKKLMEPYFKETFVGGDGQLNCIPCWYYSKQVFDGLGLTGKDEQQVLGDDILILPVRAMCPYHFETGKLTKSADTYSIHWYAASWHDGWFRFKKNCSRKIKSLIGADTYRSLKKKLHLG